MDQIYLPLDLTLPKLKSSANPTPDSSARLPLKPHHRNEKWSSAWAAARENRFNAGKWSTLFSTLDDCWNAALNADRDSKASTEAGIRSCYVEYLHWFPLLVEVWKAFLIICFKMSGLRDSLECLESAVAACPQNILLWSDYLGALIAVSKTPDYLDPPSNEHIHAELERAVATAGLNFNSDPIWDKYIEFERSLATQDLQDRLICLYLRLIELPLYQYAQYYSQFMEVAKLASPLKFIDAERLKHLLLQHEKTSVEDLSPVESHQVFEAFAYEVFNLTQQKVTELWPFESSLTHQDFSLADLEAIRAQKPAWLKYLDHEIAVLASASNEFLSKQQYSLVESLFERCLVPNCYDDSLWLKFVEFVGSNATTPLEAQKSIMRRAILQVVPVSKSKLRDEFVQLLIRNRQLEAANDFLLETIRLFSGVAEAKVYVKTEYVRDLKALLILWETHGLDALAVLERLNSDYFEKIDRYKKELTTKEAQVVEKDELKFTITPAMILNLSRYINDDGICVIASQTLKALDNDSLEAKAQIRKFYNRFHTEPVFSRSVQFWRFFVEYEGYKQKCLPNLRTIMSYVKTKTALPKKAVDIFLDIYYEVTCDNLAQAVALLGKEDYLDILTSISSEKSDDLYLNTSARSRLAHNSSALSDYRGTEFASKEEHLMTQRSHHLAHPGIFIDHKPALSKSTMGEWVSLLADDIKIPPLPAVINAERINAPVKYPSEN